MIASEKEFLELVDSLKDLPRIALDTEADSLHSYFEKLCLIQLALPSGSCLLIDPLSKLSLQPFFDVLRDKTIIIHGADYDLRLLRRCGNFEVSEVFDTTIAARLISASELGLAALVKRYFDVVLCKESQRANWGIRPLPPQMMEYALNDVRYLLELADILSAELHRLGRWEWFVETRDRMVESTKETRERDVDRLWRITGSSALDPRAQAVVREVWRWRDSEAREWNRPAFHVMSNHDILRIASAGVAGDPLPAIRLPSQRSQRLQQVLESALALPQSEWPTAIRGVRRRPSREEQDRYEHFKTKRDEVAKDLGLDPAILAPRAALEATAENPKSNHLMKWQKALLGIENESPENA
ncbi:MAG: HRDC domain-containing protein [Chthoniobacterales bacterium]